MIFILRGTVRISVVSGEDEVSCSAAGKARNRLTSFGQLDEV